MKQILIPFVVGLIVGATVFYFVIRKNPGLMDKSYKEALIKKDRLIQEVKDELAKLTGK